MIRFLGIRTYQMVGVPSEQAWSQVHVFIPFTREEVLGLGGLLLTLRLQGEDDPSASSGQSLAAVGNDWIERIGNDFVQNGDKPRVDWIVSAIENFKHRFGDTGSIVMAVVLPCMEGKRSVYLHGWGLGMKVLLERENEKLILWEDLSRGPLSGWLNKEDVMIMGTDKTVSEIWAAIEGGDAEEKGEAAGALIGSRDDSYDLAGVAVEIDDMDLQPEEIFEEQNNDKEEIGLEMGRLSINKEESEPVVEVESPHLDENVLIDFQPEAEQPVVTVKEPDKVHLWNKFFRPKSKHDAFLSDNPHKKMTKASLLVGGLFVFLLVMSVGFGKLQKDRQVERDEYLKISEPLAHQLQEAEALKELNPGRARSLVVGVKQTLESQKDRYDKTRFEKEWDLLISQTESIWKDVSGENETPGEKWLNLEVVKAGVTADDLFISGEWLVVWDKKQGLFIKVKLQDKAASLAAAGENFKEGVDASDLGGIGVILTKTGINQIDIVSGKTDEVAQADGEDWQTWKLVGSYLGNVYTVGSKDIWKFPKVDDGYGKKRRWLLAGVEPDLSQATAMAIDGDVWVAIRSGEIYRFRLGNKEQFSVKNMVGEWGEVAGLGLSEDKGLIAWDKGNSRIVNINKETGEYIKQWKWQTLGEADSFVWDEGRNRVIIGKGSDLWSFKLD